MASWYERQAVLFPIKSLGQFQYSFMWRIDMPYIPIVGPNLEISYQAKSTSVPDIKLESTIIKTIGGKEFTLPHKKEYTHDWNVVLLLPDIDFLVRKLFVWFTLIDYLPIEVLKTSATISLLSLNGKVVNKLYRLSGIYPKNSPSISDLSYDSVTDLITLEQQFAVDEILPI